MEFKTVYKKYKVSKCGIVLGVKGQPLAQCDNGRGYLIVGIFANGKWTSKGVHRLVAEAWLENADNQEEVNHKDCNRYNNSVDNLEWCSHSYNVAYSYSTGSRDVSGSNNANCKTDVETVHKICEMLQSGLSSAKIRDLGYNYDLVRAIKSRKNWNEISVNYHW